MIERPNPHKTNVEPINKPKTDTTTRDVKTDKPKASERDSLVKEHATPIEDLLERSKKLALTKEILFDDTDNNKSQLKDAIGLMVDLSKISDKDALSQFPAYLTGMPFEDINEEGFIQLLEHARKLGITENDYNNILENSSLGNDGILIEKFAFYDSAFQSATTAEEKTKLAHSALDLIAETLYEERLNGSVGGCLADLGMEGLVKTLLAKDLPGEQDRLDYAKSIIGKTSYAEILDIVNENTEPTTKRDQSNTDKLKSDLETIKQKISGNLENYDQIVLSIDGREDRSETIDIHTGRYSFDWLFDDYLKSVAENPMTKERGDIFEDFGGIQHLIIPPGVKVESIECRDGISPETVSIPEEYNYDTNRWESEKVVDKRTFYIDIKTEHDDF